MPGRRWLPTLFGKRPRAAAHPVLHHGARGLVAIALAVATYLLFPTAPAIEFPVLEVGTVAPENVIAPFAFRVPKSTE